MWHCWTLGLKLDEELDKIVVCALAEKSTSRCGSREFFLIK